MTMPTPDLFAFLTAHPVFTREQLAGFLGEAPTPSSHSRGLRNALRHLEQVHEVQSVRRGVYTARAVAGTKVDPYLVAARSEPSAILSYGSALAWHLGRPCPQCVHVISLQLTRSWSFWKIYTVQPVQINARPTGILQQDHQGVSIRITSRERTLVDVLDRPDLTGDRAKAWASLESLILRAPIDIEALIAYLKELHCKTTSSKVSFFLDTFRGLLGLRNEDFRRFGSDELPFVRSPVYWDWTRRPQWEDAAPWSLRPDLSIRVPSKLARKEPDESRPGIRKPEPPSTWLEPDRPSDFLESHLSHHFGFEAYRPGQKAALVKILNGQDALEVLPTGTGKSLIYLQAACLLHGAVLVISPLISLIQDQVMEARAFGLVAYPLHAKGRQQFLEEVRKRLRMGRVDLLFMPPEAWEGIVRALPELKRDLGLIVIDEAHVVPTWGPSFRRSYLTLEALGKTFPKVPMLALTATATPETQKEIIECLGLQGLETEPRLRVPA